MGIKISDMERHCYRKFSISSDYFSHYVMIIDIYDDNTKEYKSMENIINECKKLLFDYIYNLDFKDKTKLKKEFKKKDLWILEKMLDENDKDLNLENLVNILLNKKFYYHDYDINQIINDKNGINNTYYICDHCHD